MRHIDEHYNNNINMLYKKTYKSAMNTDNISKFIRPPCFYQSLSFILIYFMPSIIRL